MREREREGEAKPSEQVTKATGSQMIGPKSSEGQQRQRQQQQKNCDQKYADSRRVIPLSNPTTTSRQTDDAASLWRSSNYDDVAFAKATQQIKGGKKNRKKRISTICNAHMYIVPLLPLLHIFSNSFPTDYLYLPLSLFVLSRA